MARTPRSSSLRSKTPPGVNTVTVSDFVRGQIYDLETPTVIVSHGTELGTWYPRGQGATTNFYNSNTTQDAFGSSSLMGSTTLTGSQPTLPPVDVEGLNAAVKQLHEYLRRLPQAAEEEEPNG